MIIEEILSPITFATDNRELENGIKEMQRITLREKCPNTEFFLVRIILYAD